MAKIKNQQTTKREWRSGCSGRCCAVVYVRFVCGGCAFFVFLAQKGANARCNQSPQGSRASWGESGSRDQVLRAVPLQQFDWRRATEICCSVVVWFAGGWSAKRRQQRKERKKCLTVVGRGGEDGRNGWVPKSQWQICLAPYSCVCATRPDRACIAIRSPRNTCSPAVGSPSLASPCPLPALSLCHLLAHKTTPPLCHPHRKNSRIKFRYFVPFFVLSCTTTRPTLLYSTQSPASLKRGTQTTFSIEKMSFPQP